MAHDIFLSYSSRDKFAADAACAVLERNGVRVWMAPRDIIAGMDWGASIISAIHGARAMVLVFSGNANESLQVKLEVERAISKGLPIIPFRIENVEPSASLELFISTSHWLDAFTKPLEQHLEELAKVVRLLIEIKYGKSQTPVDQPRLPVQNQDKQEQESGSTSTEEAFPRMKQANGASSVDEKKSPRPERSALASVAVAIAIIAAGGFLWRSGIMHEEKTPVVSREEPKSPNPLPAPSPEPAWTAWMDQEAYQQEFNRQVKNRWYPNMIEAALQSGVIMYRAVYEPYPSTTFEFYSRHSISDEEFRDFDAKMLSAGFTRVFQQRIIVHTRAFNQATWTKQ